MKNFLDIKDGEVLLIRNSNRGKKYAIQYDGCGCLCHEGKGMVVGRFMCKYKYFRPSFWYNRASWLDDLGWIAFFKNKKQRELFYQYVGFFSKKDHTERSLAEGNRKATILLMKDAVDADKVLHSILRYASRKLGVELKPAGPFCVFNTHWREAFIPVTCNDKYDYTLTWSNCD